MTDSKCPIDRNSRGPFLVSIFYAARPLSEALVLRHSLSELGVERALFVMNGLSEGKPPITRSDWDTITFESNLGYWGAFESLLRDDTFADLDASSWIIVCNSDLTFSSPFDNEFLGEADELTSDVWFAVPEYEGAVWPARISSKGSWIRNFSLLIVLFS